MTNGVSCVILIPETKNNYFIERNCIMKVTAFAYAYRECQAIFQSEERSFAKHAHFEISKSNMVGMIS